MVCYVIHFPHHMQFIFDSSNYYIITQYGTVYIGIAMGIVQHYNHTQGNFQFSLSVSIQSDF